MISDDFLDRHLTLYYKSCASINQSIILILTSFMGPACGRRFLRAFNFHQDVGF